MCDQDSMDDIVAYELKNRGLSRRQFGAATLGLGLASYLPAADAVQVQEADVQIKTPDGTCDAYLVHPLKGKHPGVLVWPDIFGLRPAFRQMGKRLAGSGYAVLVVNPFYRTKKAPTSPPNPDFQDPATRQMLIGLMSSLTPPRVLTDAQAFVPWLDSQAAVDKRRKMGTTGYCMGGPFTLRTAAAFPDRIGAGASFHGANLVTDGPDSPHLLVPRMHAQFLIAIADNDDQRDPKAKDVLREAFAQAHLTAEIEVYKGAQHGWCPPDSHVYNHDLAEKAWSRQMVLFGKALA
ncbi:MAG TPA: dienelactone hydrolase family protein [Steroidobacteraceae bacterium]|nr:dienelactone hydrolase family protein [Steroidobacteraceae bacterium]